MKRQELLDRRKKLLLFICLVFILAILILIGWIYFVNRFNYDRKYNDTYYSLKYDNTWSIIKKENNRVVFSHKTDSLVDIKANKLDKKTKKSSIRELAQEIRYDIEKNNTDYVLINEEETTISSNKYDSYKLLYEDKDYQTLVVIEKNNNYVVITSYTAKNNYFDILLDSVQLIIGSIVLK